MKNYVFFLVFVLFVFFTHSADSQNMKIGGYMQTWLILNQQTAKINASPGIEDQTSGFRIRRARLNFKTDINETFSVNTWFEFAEASKNMLDFYVEAKVSDALKFTIGQFITPAQTYETSKLASSKISLYELADISLNLSRNMGHDSYRDVGIMANGKIEIVEYSLYYGNGNGRFFYASNNILNRKFGNGLYGIRLDAEISKGLNIGMHYSANIQDSNYVSDPITSVKSTRHRDRNSYSFNLVSDGFGLPDLFSTIIYASGKIKDGSNVDYDGFTATIGYKILPYLHIIGRYDTYNEKYPNTTKQKIENNSTVFGINYLFLKEKSEIAKIGVNYQIRKEKPTEIDNNIFLLWMQVKF